MSTSPAPNLEFDWGVYADATFAGLSLLIPFPFLDSAFEWFFRQRMPRSIARWRGRHLPPEAAAELNRTDSGCLRSCLIYPLTLGVEVIKRLSKKVLYFLTLKDATDRLSYYWHRAFLLDYALIEGRLNDAASARLTRLALDRVLRPEVISPMVHLAQQIVPRTQHVLATLRRARAGREDEVIREKRSVMRAAWEEFGEHLAGVAERFDQAYAALRAEAQAEAQAEADARMKAAAQAQATAPGEASAAAEAGGAPQAVHGPQAESGPQAVPGGPTSQTPPAGSA